MELSYTAKEEKRLSALLKEEMGLSSGLMNRLKWQDKLFVNGISRRTNYMVQPGDVVAVPLDEEKPSYPAEEGSLTVLYEDEHILAVDKPAGMLVHPSRATMTGTLANRVLGYYQKTGQSCAFHPVTRLDRDTFGVVLLAKNPYIHACFTDLQEKGGLEKTYEALVVGCPEKNEGIIDAPIARRPLPSLLRYVDESGKPSQSQYRVLERGEISRLRLQPVTGRTHQLRVHCAYMGFPILGDPQYATESSRKKSEQLGLTTQQLCAKSIRFTHPITGEDTQIISKMSPEAQAIF